MTIPDVTHQRSKLITTGPFLSLWIVKSSLSINCDVTLVQVAKLFNPNCRGRFLPSSERRLDVAHINSENYNQPTLTTAREIQEYQVFVSELLLVTSRLCKLPWR